ncbi:MAG: hypothetical protein MRK02_13945 [Candidatus Scalindua sp.]|nr:hypothetical protein [Candidatus Scalindua sp.]
MGCRSGERYQTHTKAVTKDKFITDCDAGTMNVLSVLERHKEQFVEYPEVLVADKRFRSEPKEMEEHE